ncbi:hypothetical protein JG688_00001080 [Phytophthora aleatoria]|uniref:Uncharacterized protein n=1 Tax=Phytophthora aleatoria TaxID=2496075 RepID=A0A8J5JH02_9STRA|nr:hypothetical protein JG688_00001080 [Phytophthora aleatoria]
MLSAPRTRSIFSNEQVSAFFFIPCSDQHDEPIPEYSRCLCGKVSKQTRRNRFTYLMQHVCSEHPSFQEDMLAATPATTWSVEHYARRTAMNRFGWLEWTPARTRRLVGIRTNPEPISVEKQWRVSRAWWRQPLGPIYAMSSGSYWTDGATRWGTR